MWTDEDYGWEVPEYIQNVADSKRSESKKKRGSRTLDDDDPVVLTRWDKASRIWLSSGTFLILIAIFHAIQLRSDLRKYTTKALDKLQSTCLSYEEQANALQDAIGHSSTDVGPITLKFVQTMGTGVKKSFYFGTQILGAKIRTFLMSKLGNYYCLLLGIIVLVQEITDVIINALHGSMDFLENILGAARELLGHVLRYARQPGAIFRDVIDKFVKTDEVELSVATILPKIDRLPLEFCRLVGNVDFENLYHSIKIYLLCLIAALAVLLIVFNVIQYFVVLNEYEEDEDLTRQVEQIVRHENVEDIRRQRLLQLNQNREASSIASKARAFLSTFITSRRGRRKSHWLVLFLSYPPLWIFLLMGLVGLLHIHLNNRALLLAKELKRDHIDPLVITVAHEIKETFKAFVVKIDRDWRLVVVEALGPILKLITTLKSWFSVIYEGVKILRNTLVTLINGFTTVLQAFAKPIIPALKEILKCMFLRKLENFYKISRRIHKISFSPSKPLRMGVFSILKRSLRNIFKNVRLVKKLHFVFTASFVLFLMMLKKKSSFFYVYVIAALILFLQAAILLFFKSFSGGP